MTQRLLFRKILVAHDGSEPADRAFEKALALAILTGVQLHVIFVAEPPLFAATIHGVVHFKETTEKCFKDLSKKLQDRAERVTVRAHIEYGRTVETIVEYIQNHDFDLLVIGAMGRSNVFKRLIGNWCSTAHNLARLAPCAVLIVK
jgi:nucleotide-binding universal stress UspA family protein